MNKFLLYVFEFIITIVIALIVYLTISAFVQLGTVEGSSMMPTYQDGNKVIIQKKLYNLERGDIVAFRYSEENEKYYEDVQQEEYGSFTDYEKMVGELHIKRIVGIPGDKIDLKDGVLRINGQEVSTTENLAIPNQEYQLKDDEYFLAGDNNIVSFDSRFHGPVTKDEIYGKILTKK